MIRLSKIPIVEFKGSNSFLSNFYLSEFEFEGEVYPSAEHAFQAHKTFSKADREKIRTAPTPGAAKRLGRRVRLRANWDRVKVSVMFSIVETKFRDPELRKKLLATGDRKLIEGNHWGDTFWGKCNGVGENHLGKILMELRQEIRDGVVIGG